MFRPFQIRVIVLLVLNLLLTCPPSSAQLQTNSGKSWKSGSASNSEFVQLTVTHGTTPQISGTISVRSYGLWQGAHVKEFSGMQSKLSNFVRLDCECSDGMKFYGWYWPGPTGTRGDDRVAIYFRPMATPSEVQPECHPNKEHLAFESETELVE